MADDQHEGLPVHGYQPQSELNVQRVNRHKVLEEHALRYYDELAQDPNVDKRWLAIGRTALEQSFMAMNRAVFKPQRVRLEGDEQG